ncbi:MAG: gliding motility lipoprotein GldH [Prevotella sp.]|nr:gliding motility lipoprotein GldH [Prevotella sp.]
MILAASILFCACGRQKEYSNFQHVSTTGWDKTDTLFFDIPPIKKDGTYREELELRIDNNFPFQSLTLEVIQTILPSDRQTNYELHCPLIDQKGNMRGAGISFFQYTFPIDNMLLSTGDSIHISVTHKMKREIMSGVADVGISLTKQ